MRSLFPWWCGAALLALGCGRPFDIETASSFAELQRQPSVGYDFRAVSPDGLAVAVHALDDQPDADVAFWVKSVILRLRDQSGYALLAQEPVRSKDGSAGVRLRFGRDEGATQLLYQVSVYRSQSRVFVLESGGPKAEFEANAKKIEAMERSLAVRCPHVLAPVLASRTCNRW